MNERVDEGAMQQFDDGILRAYLDGDAVLDEALRARIAAALADDDALAARLTALRADADAVESAFAAFPVEEPDAAHLQRAYRRIQTRLTTEPHAGIIRNLKEKFVTMTSQQSCRADAPPHLRRHARRRRPHPRSRLRARRAISSAPR